MVPLTRDEGLSYVAYAERIDPTSEYRVETTSWALAHLVTSVSLRRVQATPSRVTAKQLSSASAKSSCVEGLRPAPVIPLFASTTSWTISLAKGASGKSASSAALAGRANA